MNAPLEAPRPAVHFAAGQLLGTRLQQEDSYCIVNDLLWPGSGQPARQGSLFVLCDGMGGHDAGALASRFVADLFAAELTRNRNGLQDAMRATLDLCNSALADYSRQIGVRKMGTTLLALWVDAGAAAAQWISVGDSPLWLLRAGELRRLNADHSMRPVFQRMVQRGMMSAADAALRGDRHALRASIHGGEIGECDLPAAPLPLLPDDLLVLASDGVDTLAPEQLGAVLHQHASSCTDGVDATLQAITRQAAAEQDNASLILVRWSGNSAATTATQPVAAPRRRRRPWWQWWTHS